MSFSKNLSKHRKSKGLSQEQLAFQIGVSRQAVSKWETGLSQPELSNIEKICEVLDMTPNDLMGFEVISSADNHKNHKFIIIGLIIFIFICSSFILFNYYTQPNQQQYHGFYVNELKMKLTNTCNDHKSYHLSFYPSMSNENFDYTIIVEYDNGHVEKFNARYNQGQCISEIRLQKDNDAMLYAHIKYENIVFSSPLMKIWAIKEEGN